MAKEEEAVERPTEHPREPAEGCVHLAGLERAGVRVLLEELGVPDGQLRMRTQQLFRWIFARGARDFAEMTDLPKELREALAARASLVRPTVAAKQQSADGTIKWLLRLSDGREVETVFIPGDGRGTLCISSQVGCTLSCPFCHTGTMPLVRNLAAHEILGQVLLALDELGDWPRTPDPDRPRLVTNVVFMGMGEPLFNYDAVATAVRLLLDREGLGFSRRRVTVSTAGVVPAIERMGRELGVRLAVSLHAPDDERRNRLVPLNRKWPLAELMEACRRYPGGRHITFEYVMLEGVNDSDEDARALLRLLEGLPAKVNLIPFNPWPGSSFRCSPPARMRAFRDILEQGGIEAPVRTPRGRDILAACGQLKTASERARRQRAA